MFRRDLLSSSGVDGTVGTVGTLVHVLLSILLHYDEHKSTQGRKLAREENDRDASKLEEKAKASELIAR